MPFVEWTEELSVGVATIDADHKKLVAMVNALHDGVHSGRDREVMAQILDGLISYCKVHFAREERYFALAHYEHAEAHTAEHAALTQRALEVQRRFKAGEADMLTPELMEMLRDWLLKHIQGSDRRYAPCFQAKGIH